MQEGLSQWQAGTPGHSPNPPLGLARAPEWGFLLSQCSPHKGAFCLGLPKEPSLPPASFSSARCKTLMQEQESECFWGGASHRCCSTVSKHSLQLLSGGSGPSGMGSTRALATYPGPLPRLVLVTSTFETFKYYPFPGVKHNHYKVIDWRIGSTPVCPVASRLWPQLQAREARLDHEL